MDGVDAYAKVNEAIANISAILDERPRLARELAEADAAYNIAYRKRMLYYRDVDGRPVGMLEKLVRGSEDIANLRTARTCAEEAYETSKSAELYWKRVMGWYEDVIRREWSRSQ